MPRLVKLYIQQVAIGFAIAAIFTAGILYLNIGNLGALTARSADGPLAVFLLFLFNGIVFSGVQFGIAIMRLGADEEPKGGSRSPVAADPDPVLVSVRIRDRD